MSFQARRIVPDGAVRPGLNLSGADLPQHRILVEGAAIDQVALATGVAAPFAGVSMELIANGITGDVQKHGKATVEAGAAVAKGVNVTSDGTGRGILAASTNNVVGRSVTAATGAGDIFEVELVPQPQVAP